MSKLARDKRKSKKRKFKLLRTIGLLNMWRIWRRRKNKHVLMTGPVSRYVEHISAQATPTHLVDLYNTSLQKHNGGMQVELSEALFLDMLVRMTGAKSILEIGTFRGWSAAVLAHALYDVTNKLSGFGNNSSRTQNVNLTDSIHNSESYIGIKTIELRQEQASEAEEFWKSYLKEDVRTLIDLVIGDARQIVKDLDQVYVQNLDLIFIDADKAEYENYIRLLAPRIRSGALVVLDNMLNVGLVATGASDRTTAAIKGLNQQLVTDSNMKEWFDISLVPAWDGVVILRKK